MTSTMHGSRRFIQMQQTQSLLLNFGFIVSQALGSKSGVLTIPINLEHSLHGLQPLARQRTPCSPLLQTVLGHPAKKFVAPD